MRNLILYAFIFISTLPLYSQQKKTTVAVIDFQSAGGFEKTEITILTNRFRNMLVKTQTFDVVEREEMNEVLKAQDFIMSDNCNTAECAVQVGQLLGVEAIVAGDIGLFGETYTIDLRIIDVTTGKIFQSETQDYIGKMDGLLGVMQTMAQALAGVVTQRNVIKQFELTVVASSPDQNQSADIWIDGKNAGKNFVKLSLPEGKHHLTVKTNSQNYTVLTKEVFLMSDQTIEAKLDYSDAYRQRLAEETAKTKAANEREEKAALAGAASKPSNKKLWYIIGGVAVIGGASAVLLSGGNSKGSTKIPDMDLPPE